MPCRGSTVAALNQSRNGATRWVIPMVLDFACIICHAVAGNKKGDTISGCTKEKGDRDSRGTETLYILGVSGGMRRCPGARRSNKASISATGGTAISDGVIRSGCTTTVSGRRPR